MAHSLYTYSIGQFNQSSGMWFDPSNPRYSDGYDGRAAYHQMISITWFLMHMNEIQDVFPEIHSDLMTVAERSMVLFDDYNLDTGTFYYLPEVPDYTESASLVLFCYELLKQTFGSDHSSNQLNAANTLLARQSSEGSYYETNNTEGEVWYTTDNIPFYLWKYLELAGEFNTANSSISEDPESKKTTATVYSSIPILVTAGAIVVIRRKHRNPS